MYQGKHLIAVAQCTGIVTANTAVTATLLLLLLLLGAAGLLLRLHTA